MAMDDDELTRFLIQMGLGMMGSRTLPEGLSRGGMFGLQGVDNVREYKAKKALTDAKLREEDLQARQREIALKQAEGWERAMQSLQGGVQAQQGAARAQTQSVVNTPEWAGSQMNPYGQNVAPSMAAKPLDQNAVLRDLALRFPAQVKQIFEAQKAGDDKVYGEPQKDADGKVFVLTDRGPKYISGGFVPRDKLVNVDMGGSIGMRTEYDPKIVASLPKGMSPAERDASARGWANFNRGDLKEVAGPDGAKSWAYIGTGKGGAPTVTQTGAVSAPPEVPASIRTALAQNNVTLTKIDTALELVDKSPGSFGWKNVMGDWVRQRTDPEGVDARALVADIGSQKIHDRSGAAVTLSEAPRLTPFVPNVNDHPDTIKKKLANFRSEYAQMQNELSNGLNINQVAGMKNKNVGSVRMGDVQGDPLAEARRRGLIR